MRKFTVVSGGLLAAMTLATAVGCGPTEVTSTPDKGSVEAPTTQATAAKVGDTITLKSNDSGLKVAVTLMKVVPTAKSSEYSDPEPGNRMAALQIRLKNVGTVAYTDAPTNGASVIDAQDQEHGASILEIELRPALDFPTIAPGSARVGYLAFEVPKSAKLAKFQFTLDSGYGPQSGEWSLR